MHRALWLCLVATTACGSSSQPSTKGPFSGVFTATTAFFEAAVGGGISVYLLSENTTCAQWQDPNYLLDPASYALEIDIGGNTPGVYNVFDPNVANNGDAVAYDSANNTEVVGASGTVSLTDVTAGSDAEGSAHIVWGDQERLTVAPFSAAYCPIIPGYFGGTFATQSAFYADGAGSSGEDGYTIYLLTQAMSCTDWQNPNILLDPTTYTLEIDMYGTTVGTYEVVQESAVILGQAAADDSLQGGGQIDSASGTLNVTAVSPNLSLSGSFQTLWNDGTTLNAPPFTAVYCPFPQ